MVVSLNIEEMYMAVLKGIAQYELVPAPESTDTTLCLSALQGMR